MRWVLESIHTEKYTGRHQVSGALSSIKDTVIVGTRVRLKRSLILRNGTTHSLL